MRDLHLKALNLLAEGAAPASNGQGVAIVLPVPKADADALVIEAGLTAPELHLTLAYLGKRDTVDAETVARLKRGLKAWAQGKAPIPALVGGIGRFCGPPEEGDPVIALVDAPRLIERGSLLKVVRDAGGKVSMKHGFTPHVTLAYINAEEDLPVQRMKPREIVFDTLELWLGDFEHTSYSFDADYDTPDASMRRAPVLEARRRSEWLV